MAAGGAKLLTGACALLAAAILCAAERGAGSVVSGEDSQWRIRNYADWDELPEVDGDASHLIEYALPPDAAPPADHAQVQAAFTPGKGFYWKPLWHGDAGPGGAGGAAILAHGVSPDGSGSWLAERIGKAPGPFSTLLISADNRSGVIAGGRLLDRTLVTCGAWSAEGSGWLAATARQDRYSESDRSSILLVPFNLSEPVSEMVFTGGTVTAMCTTAGGGLWLAGEDHRIWYSASPLGGWPFREIMRASGPVVLTLSADGETVFIAEKGRVCLYTRAGDRITEMECGCDTPVRLAAADRDSAMLIDRDAVLWCIHGGIVRDTGMTALDVVWMQERDSYMAALDRRQYIELLDRQGHTENVSGKSRFGAIEFLLPTGGDSVIGFSSGGGFSRITPTRRTFKFAPVFGGR